MQGLGRRVLLSLLLAVGVFAGFGVYADFRELGESLSAFSWWVIAPALALALGNYLLRFVRWHYYLRYVGVSISRAESLGVFLSGLAMSITPGKLGELLKGVLLRERAGTPLSTSAPVVVAERLTDFVAVLLLCVGGVASTQYGIEIVLIAAGLCVAFVLLFTLGPVSMRLLRLAHGIPGLRRFAPSLERAYVHMAALVRPVPLLVATALGVVAWFLECLAFYVVLQGFPGVTATLGQATFIYAFATIAGAITMLPGGLVFTEGSMIVLLQSVFAVTPGREVATAATLVVRFCTLWFAVLVGFVALLVMRRRSGGRADAAAEEPASSAGSA